MDWLENMSATGRLAVLVDQDHIGAPGVTPTGNATFAADRRPWWSIGARMAPGRGLSRRRSAASTAWCSHGARRDVCSPGDHRHRHVREP